MCFDNLSNNDYVLSGQHRCHGHYIAKQGDIRAMIAEPYGKVTGCSMGKGGSMHLLDLSVGYLGSSPIVGSTIPTIAVDRKRTRKLIVGLKNFVVYSGWKVHLYLIPA